MVALVFGQLACIVFVFLTDGHRLRCAGFARTGVSRASKHPRRGARGDHPHQAVAHHFHVLRLVTQILRLLGAHLGLGVGQRVLCGRDHSGFELPATIGQGGGGRGQLQHGEGVVTLTNPQ